MPNSHLFTTCKLCDYLNKNIQRVFMLIIFLMSFLLATTVHSATINASSCSQSDVQSAIDSASTGDTVVVPAGQCTWDNSITIPTGVTLMGAGIGQTVITRSALAVAVSMGDNSRLTGFEFRSASLMAYLVHNWRIDHCKVTHTSFGTGFLARGNDDGQATGLIDNCEFVNVRLSSHGNVNLFPDILWYKSLDLGGSDNIVYIENCTWNNTTGVRAVTDSNYSGQYVIRFCTINDGYFEGHGARDSRGIKRWEIYRNTINNTTLSSVMNIRGGTGVIFDNTSSSGESANKWYFGIERADTTYTYSGKCDGNSTWDTYPHPATGSDRLCRDQIGAGQDTQLGADTQDEAPYAQMSSPAYLWNNTRGASPFNFYIAYGASLQIENRDFYVDDSSNVSITGGGVAIGILANRPSTCTPGVAYWATDQGSWNKIPGGEQGVLYKCISKNTWEKYYEPYEYPHPLTKETVIAAPELMLKDTFSGGSVWTKSTGKTYTYYLTSKKYGGKNIKKVSEDGAELVETASVDLCESTTGSYFVDPSDGTVHVHCTDGTDADTHEIGVCYN